MSLDTWLAALEERHLANLTRSELTRALRALSSCYIERRDKLSTGAPLESAGKRAAFALFYGPLHFLTIGAIVRAIGADRRRLDTIHDLGCGTGVGGAAWALACAQPPRVRGMDRNAWAVAEANWNYKALGVNGRARTGNVVKESGDLPSGRAGERAESPILLAYVVNELPDAGRAELLRALTEVAKKRGSFLVVEPIAKRDRPWWPEWAARLTAEGARTDEWRFPADLPPALRQFAKSAGLDPRELTGRTIFTG